VRHVGYLQEYLQEFMKPVEYTDNIPTNDVKDHVFIMNVHWVGHLGIPGNVLAIVSIFATNP
jgi:hypothetical protein